MANSNSFVAAIPGPVLYDTGFDWACILQNNQCSDTQTCLIYDVTDYRLYLHGITIFFLIISMVLAAVAWMSVYHAKEKQELAVPPSHMNRSNGMGESLESGQEKKLLRRSSSANKTTVQKTSFDSDL